MYTNVRRDCPLRFDVFKVLRECNDSFSNQLAFPVLLLNRRLGESSLRILTKMRIRQASSCILRRWRTSPEMCSWSPRKWRCTSAHKRAASGTRTRRTANSPYLRNYIMHLRPRGETNGRIKIALSNVYISLARVSARGSLAPGRKPSLRPVRNAAKINAVATIAVIWRRNYPIYAVTGSGAGRWKRPCPVRSRKHSWSISGTV